MSFSWDDVSDFLQVISEALKDKPPRRGGPCGLVIGAGIRGGRVRAQANVLRRDLFMNWVERRPSDKDR